MEGVYDLHSHCEEQRFTGSPENHTFISFIGFNNITVIILLD